MLLLKLSMAAYWLSNLMDQLVHESCLVDIDGLNGITFQQCLLIPVGVGIPVGTD